MTDPADDKPNGGEDFAALFAESEAAEKSRQRVRAGDLVRGRVVALGAQSAFVAIGAKAEAVIDLAEFRDAETGEVGLAVGDQIEATVTDDGSRSGSIVLKRTLGRGGHVPGELEQALEHGIAVEGVVTGQNKGGFDVKIAGQRAFCPAGQIDVRRGDPPQYVGQRLRFRVTKIEAGGRGRVGLSLRALQPDPWRTAVERFPAGATVKGKVRRLEQFGAFVEIALGLEGLVHVSRLALERRISHPRQVVTIGDEVEVTVVSVDPEKRRIALSMVESARRARDAEEIAESSETTDLLDRSNEARSFGTLSDLLAAPKKPKPER